MVPVLVVVLAISSCADAASAAVIDLADSSLAAAVHATLGDTDPSSPTQLIARSVGITDLTGIEALTGLTTLDLSDNLIRDISPLARLSGLILLDLEHNRIADLAPLAPLRQLESLVLSYNQISDLSPLLEIPSLQSLDLIGNPLSRASLDLHIASLQEHGVQVYFDEPEEPAAPPARPEAGWEAIGPAGETRDLVVRHAAFDPRDPDTVICTAQESGVWRSHDGGYEWERTSRMQGGVADVVIGPDAVLYTAGARSHDWGDTWVSARAVVAADLLQAGRAYTVDYDSLPGGEAIRLVRVSDDYGYTWRDTEAILETSTTGRLWMRHFIWIHPTDPHVLYAGGIVLNDQGFWVVQTLYCSDDGGDTWGVRETDLGIQALAPDPGNRDHVYALNRKALWHSTDEGWAWESRGPVPRVSLDRLAVHPEDGQRVFAWRHLGEAWRSVDGGRHWQALDLPVSSLAPHPHDPEHWLMVSAAGALLRTTDGGVSWEPTGPQEETVAAWGLAVAADGDLCVGTGRRHSGYLHDPILYRSSNQGADWTVDEPLVPPDVSRPFEWLHANPHQPNLFMAYVGWPVGLVRSEDGGATWEQVLLEEGGDAYRAYEPPRIAAAGATGEVYYAVDPNTQVLYRSDNWGRTWERRQDDLAVFAQHPTEPDVIVAYSGARGVVASDDGGITWEERGSGPGSGQEAITRMVLVPGFPMRLYAVADNALHASTDGGTTWTQLRRLSYTRVRRIMFDPGDTGHMVLVSPAELLETRDQGATWESLVLDPAILPYYFDAALDPTDPSLLYVATPWGVYRRHLPDPGTAVAIGPARLPTAALLSQNYPNPFNAGTVLRCTLPHRARASLTIYDMLGQPVRRLASGTLEAGQHSMWWGGTDEAGRDVASGIYLYELRVGSLRRVRRMALIR